MNFYLMHKTEAKWQGVWIIYGTFSHVRSETTRPRTWIMILNPNIQGLMSIYWTLADWWTTKYVSRYGILQYSVEKNIEILLKVPVYIYTTLYQCGFRMIETVNLIRFLTNVRTCIKSHQQDQPLTTQD